MFCFRLRFGFCPPDGDSAGVDLLFMDFPGNSVFFFLFALFSDSALGPVSFERADQTRESLKGQIVGLCVVFFQRKRELYRKAS